MSRFYGGSEHFGEGLCQAVAGLSPLYHLTGFHALLYNSTNDGQAPLKCLQGTGLTLVGEPSTSGAHSKLRVC